jgi:hypothetical protein
MAHTKEQRDQNPLCGAQRRNGNGPCRKFAGEGTSHKGTGRCKLHGGNTPTHQKHALTLNVKRQMVTLGAPDTEVTALDAMLSELAASSGHCAWLRARIANMSEDELATPEGVAVVRLYDSERDRRVRIAKLCIEAGVDEAAIRVTELQMTIMGQGLKNACDEAGVSETMQRKIGKALRENIGRLEAELSARKLIAAR